MVKFGLLQKAYYTTNLTLEEIIKFITDFKVAQANIKRPELFVVNGRLARTTGKASDNSGGW